MNKSYIIAHEGLLVKLYNAMFFSSKKVKGQNNTLSVNGFVKHCRFIIKGNNNRITIEGELTRLSDCIFEIFGSNNSIHISKHVVINNSVFHVENNGNIISVGRDSWINPNVELSVMEGTSIRIGESCMLSANIVLRTGDSHSVLDIASGKRINPSRSIDIGNHVWIGNDAKILKGSVIGNNTIVSTGAIVTGGEGKLFTQNSVLAGVPAKVVKTGVTWDISKHFEIKDL